MDPVILAKGAPMSKKARRYLLLLAALLALAVFVGYQFYREYRKLQSLNEEKAQVLIQKDAIDQKNQETQQEIADTQSDSFIERMAREMLGWVKSGEIKIVDKDK
jgi:cell division protein FtsB